MVAGNWFNNDGLYIEFGTTKPTVDPAGEFKSYGQTRDIEINLDLTTLTTSAAIISNNVFWPATPTGTTQNIYLESVEVITETGMTASGATSFSVGLMKSSDRVTAMSDTAFVNALANASFTTSGQKTVLTNGVTSAGGYIGVPPNQTEAGYITAKSTGGTYTAGLVKIRIKYAIFGTITQ